MSKKKTEQQGLYGPTRDITVGKLPGAIMKAFKQRKKANKKLEKRTIVDEVADAVRGRR